MYPNNNTSLCIYQIMYGKMVHQMFLLIVTGFNNSTIRVTLTIKTVGLIHFINIYKFGNDSNL